MLNHNSDFHNRQVIYEKILVSNAFTLGAFAWRGYQLKSRGVIVIYGLESQASFIENIDVKIGYFSKEEAVQKCRAAIGLFQLLDEYNPNNEIVATFIDSKNGFIDSYRITLDLPPLNCYILRQEQLLSI